MKPDEGKQVADENARLPQWARELRELYLGGTTSMFVLHGNTHDLVRSADADAERYVVLAEFVAEQLFGRWDLVLHYDLARGLRPLAGRDPRRLQEMVTIANRKVRELAGLRKDPAAIFPLLDRFVHHNVMENDEDRLRVAILIDHASYVVPRGEPGQLNLQASTQLVTLLNWSSSPYVKRLNMAFVLIEEQRSALSERLVGSPHVAAIEVPLPDLDDRERFIRASFGAEKLQANSEFDAPALARLTAGISLTDVDVLVRSNIEGQGRLEADDVRRLKKRLIERQCQGLLEFIVPRWGLDTVIGHAAAKSRLRDDAALLARGALDSLPMGYLFCGAVGTGKTFLAQCATGEMGAPCVMLRNFRSKYVGETEGNLERVLSVLRAMGPVVVVIDEADAALGDRGQEGDSGTSSRVFAMIAAQMGDTRYRGKILWVLLTCRPDLLPIDLKRQGRAEVHIPLFYPTDDEEIRGLFVAMARKLGAKLAAEDVPQLSRRGELSGADIEGIVGRAWRRAQLAGREGIDRESLQAVVSGFMPSTQGFEKELQETAAILECTDRQFLPEDVLARIDADGGRGQLQRRLVQLQRLIEAS